MASSLRVVINITGHASKRWKDASSEAEAEAKNMALSRRRANHVAKVIESEFKKVLPKVPIEVREDTTFDENVKVRPKAVGSGQPLVSEGKDGDNPVNRSVEVSFILQGIDIETETVNVPALRDGRTEHWSVQQVELNAFAVGLGSGEIVLRINNEITEKSGYYRAVLKGPGLYIGNPKSYGSKITVEMLKGGNLKKLGEKAYFTTDRKLGFTDFRFRSIHVTKMSVSVGVPVPKKVPILNKIGVSVADTLVSFPGLGPDAQQRLIGFKVDLSSGTSGEAFFMSGELDSMDPLPDDDLPDTALAEIEKVRQHLIKNEMLLLFDLKSDVLSAAWKTYLTDFTNNWAKNLEVRLRYEKLI
ncbi:MAG: hypothetical protein JNL58_26895 [Planctomyces sp.]|nr:hypothetical protein [Planctomyces sp.]